MISRRIPDPLMDRALAAWREAHPEGLIGRLIELHQRDPKLARTLAYYIERYHAGRTPPGQRWPYQWLMADVAAWPAPHTAGQGAVRAHRDREVCPSCSGSGRWGDDIPCGRCEGRGAG
jgi:hypothetical protein